MNNFQLIDIGINLSNKEFEHDLNQVLLRAFQHHVEKMILTTVDEYSYFHHLELCEKYPQQLWTTYGLHPHQAKKLNHFIQKTASSFFSNSKVIAIGEFGLDYFRLLSSREEQIKTYEYFLNLSKYYSYPLFLHERHAFDDFISIFKNFSIQNKAIVHCFTGNKIEAKSYLDLGMYIGLTGWITDIKRNQSVLESLPFIPLDRLLIETDAPYLKPRNFSYKSSRNEPAFLIHILDFLSDKYSIQKEKLAEILYHNTLQVFPHLQPKKKLTL